MMKELIALLVALLATYSTTKAQRTAQTINDGWRFHLGEVAEASDLSFDDNSWQIVNLPHTWNTDAYTIKNYHCGQGWYRRSVFIPESWNDRCIYLDFEGASKAATVWVNGKKAKTHRGGYTSFVVDVTELVNPGKSNTIAVEVDNDREDIPPVSADFTFFGGIYRDVWLRTTAKTHFCTDDNGGSGVIVTTPKVTDECATVAVRGIVENYADTKLRLTVESRLFSPDGTLITTRRSNIYVAAGVATEFSHEMPAVSNPQLWSPEMPTLYTLECLIIDKATRQTVDRVSHPVAFRHFSVDSEKGFMLNGKPYKLRGICRHQDQKPLGPALSDEMHRRDFRLMKDLGANFIRIAHYPQDDALLEMCDREGMLVWEEIPLVDIVTETPGYMECGEQNLREMICRHRNHPSVIIWGYMNEILIGANRIYTNPDDKARALKRTQAYAARLDSIAKALDPSRLTATAFHGINEYNEVGLSNIPDIVGWNLYQGWYGGHLTDFEKYLEQQHKNYPDHPIMVSEYGAGSDLRIRSTSPHPFDFSVEYQQKFAEHYLPVIEQTPYIIGSTYWNFIDFSAANRSESMPRINNKGLVRSNRTPKDVYHYFRSAWRNDIPVLHIAMRDFDGVLPATWQDSIIVKIYTNLPEVELTANGERLGVRKVDNFHTMFPVNISSGKLTLSARGLWNGQPVNDDATVNVVEPVDLAVNVGSDCCYTSSESNLSWLPDRPYVPGSWGHIGGNRHSTVAEILNSDDDPLFQTLLTGIEAFRFDVACGNYEVELLFADVFAPASQSTYLLGKDASERQKRATFDIIINGKTVEEGFSPTAYGAGFHAIRKKYQISAHDGSIIVEFKSRTDASPFLNAIKIAVI